MKSKTKLNDKSDSQSDVILDTPTLKRRGSQGDLNSPPVSKFKVEEFSHIKMMSVGRLKPKDEFHLEVRRGQTGGVGGCGASVRSVVITEENDENSSSSGSYGEESESISVMARSEI